MMGVGWYRGRAPRVAVLLALLVVGGVSPAVALAAPVTLEVLVRASPMWDRIEQMSEAFTRQTGIRVRFTKLPETQLYDRIALVGASANNPYDITATGHFGAAQYGAAGIFAELPPPPDAAAFIPSTLKQWSVGDKLYGWPIITDTNIYFYRKDLFQKYGIGQPPRTWDEYVQVARKLTIDRSGRSSTDSGFAPGDVEVWGAIFKGAQGPSSTGEWFNWLLSNGGEVLDDQYRIVVNQEPAVRSLELITDLLRKYRVMPPSVVGFDYTEFHNFFVQGKAAQAVNWVYMYNMSNDPAVSKVVGKVGVGTLPAGTSTRSFLGGWSWNIFASSRHKSEALEFLRYFTSAELGWTLAVELGNPPVRTANFQRLISERGEPWPVVYEQLLHGVAMNHLATGQASAIERALQLAIQQALVGEATPQEALDQAAREIDRILKEAGFPGKGSGK